MKKIFAIIFAVLLSAVSCSCAVNNSKSDTNTSQDDFKNWELLDGNAELSNDNFNLTVMEQSGEVIVTDKKTGLKYSSSAAFGNEENATSAAELSITYYDTQSVAYTLNSRKNSFDTQLYKKDNAIRVKYFIRKDAEEYLVPKVLKTDTFDELSAKLDFSDRNKLLRYYSYVKSDGNASNLEALRQQYSYLKKHDLYIVYDNLMSDEKSSLTEIMKKAGYSMDKYLEDAESMEIDISQLDISPSFNITVEYSITDNGLQAKCLSNLIEAGSSQYVLQEINLLKGFGAAGCSDNLTYLLADGSGSIVNTADEIDESYESKVYGINPVIESDNTATLAQSYRLPVFAYSSKGGSYLAVITGGSENSSVCVQTSGTKNPCDIIYTSFDFVDMDKLSIRPGSNMAQVNYYSEQQISECPEVTYFFSGADMSEYEFASIYRSYLSSQSEKDTAGSAGPLWLEFTGYTVVKTNIAGISFDKKIVLSTLSDIQNIIDDLHQKNIKGIYVRLKAFGNNGEKNGVANKFELDNKIGTIKELKKLAKTLSDNGGKLYLENDVFYSYKDTILDGFNARNDSAQTLSGGIAYDRQFDIVDLNYEKTHNPRYIISPDNYSSYFEAFVKQLKKQKDLKEISVSWSSGGSTLLADYKKGDAVDRIESRKNVQDSLEILKNNFGKSMVSGGNIYVLPYVAAITDIPLYDSNYTVFSENSIFYSAVLHGLVGYSGESISTSVYPDELVLRSIENGASLYYSLITKDEAYIELDMSNNISLLPPVAGEYMEKISQDATKLSSFYKAKAEKKIIAHKELAESVFKTEYEDGLYSIVNYSDKDYAFGDVTVKANNYYLSEVAG